MGLLSIGVYFINKRRRESVGISTGNVKEISVETDTSTIDESTELEDVVLDSSARLARESFLTRAPVISTGLDQHVPGCARIFVRTFGCSHNVSDSEFMMGLLIKYGYTLVGSLEESDLCIFNSCTVKNPSQDAAVNLVVRAESLGKKIVVTGCVPQADQSIPMFAKASMLGVGNIDSIVHVVEQTLNGNRTVLVGKSSNLPDIVSMPKIRRNKFVEIIAVSTGCLGQCTYCKTKHARGDLGSYSVLDVVARVKIAIAEGVSQIWLTSEDLGAYGLDIGSNIVELLHAVLAEIERHPQIMLRMGMTNPPYMLEHAEAVATILSHPQVFEFLHVPVQSGSNSVLLDMKREYTREDFETLVEILQERLEHITIATDVICGFPGESDEDHNETISLIEKYKFPVINISQFYPRPGTPAARMQKISTKVAKSRSLHVTRLFESYTENDHFLNSTVNVWFDLIEPTGQIFGHTKNYTKVIIERGPGVEIEQGSQRLVKIVSIHKWDIRGVLVPL